MRVRRILGSNTDRADEVCNERSPGREAGEEGDSEGQRVQWKRAACDGAQLIDVPDGAQCCLHNILACRSSLSHGELDAQQTP